MTSSFDAEDPFEISRARLLGLAYRMVGTIPDAEDVVQEAWLRWNRSDQASIERPDAWLTTVTARLAIDHIRARGRTREDYLGPWLPEPVNLDDCPEPAAEFADSLKFAFLTVLDTLKPMERAVFLLVDVFGLTYPDVSLGVGKSEAACRQIASRARRRLRTASTGRQPTGDERRIVHELLSAIAHHDVDGVLKRLAPDVVCTTDAGPDRRAARRPLVGADRVARFFLNTARQRYATARSSPALINGDPGVITYLDDEIDFAAAFEVDNGKITAIWLIRNPDKLTHIASPVPIQ